MALGRIDKFGSERSEFFGKLWQWDEPPNVAGLIEGWRLCGHDQCFFEERSKSSPIELWAFPLVPAFWKRRYTSGWYDLKKSIADTVVRLVVAWCADNGVRDAVASMAISTQNACMRHEDTVLESFYLRLRILSAFVSQFFL